MRISDWSSDVCSSDLNVVQNEKRQGDNQPFGLVEYAQLAPLFPEGHPYRHSTIGSMADLDAASLGDVKNWFSSHYGPNNAVQSERASCRARGCKYVSISVDAVSITKQHEDTKIT